LMRNTTPSKRIPEIHAFMVGEPVKEKEQVDLATWPVTRIMDHACHQILPLLRFPWGRKRNEKIFQTTKITPKRVTKYHGTRKFYFLVQLGWKGGDLIDKSQKKPSLHNKQIMLLHGKNDNV
jgi:hypothetical protein